MLGIKPSIHVALAMVDWVSTPFLLIHVQFTIHHYVVQAVLFDNQLLINNVAKFNSPVVISDVVTIPSLTAKLESQRALSGKLANQMFCSLWTFS